MTNLRPKMHPAEFRKLTGWSVYKIHSETEIPIDTLKAYLADRQSARYREPKDYIQRLFGELWTNLADQRAIA